MSGYSELPEPSPGSALRSLRTPILISGALPVLVYLLASPHMPHLVALLLAGGTPLLYGAHGWVRRHGIDLISAITLFTIAASVLLAALIHDPHILLIRDSCLTAAFGALCLLSLVTPRPMAYYVYRWAVVRSPGQLARLEAGWRIPYARLVRRLVTLVWGVAFVVEAIIDALLAYHLPAAQFVAIHPMLYWATLLAAFGWGTLYARHAQPIIDESLRERTSAGAPAAAPTVQKT